MATNPSLAPDQVALLGLLVKAWQEEREEFHTMAGDNEVRIYHPGLQKIGHNQLPVKTFDLEALDDADFIKISEHRRYGDYRFTVLQAGVEFVKVSLGE
jgi:hypothetical protein